MLPVFMSLLVYLEMHQLVHVLFNILLAQQTHQRQTDMRHGFTLPL